MGYSFRNGGQIKDFWPDDTREEMYLEAGGERSQADLNTLVEEKWPGIKPEEFVFDVEHIHTRCLTYDLYEAGDYTLFLILKASPEYFQRIEAPASAEEKVLTTV